MKTKHNKKSEPVRIIGNYWDIEINQLKEKKISADK